MEFKDKYLKCAVCGREFLWDAGEQSWYHLNGLQNEPRRCKDCRNEHRRPPKKQDSDALSIEN
ncbi:MAG: zinc-ribbon domain-containing protein [Chloroflexi bacterium]|nr:zinc-ribbon domain-containing protein [Chloroflexota bacterium]